MEGSGALRQREVHYPVADGKPMAESDLHLREMTEYVLEVLEDHWADDPRVYVAGNNFVYYREGDREAVVSPDAYVVRGVASGLRDTFKVWEEGGHRPCFVLEITSKTTEQEDQGRKLKRYRDELRVPEYFLFDPRGEWIPERLRGYVLEGGTYRPVRPDRHGRLPSGELGLELAVPERHLRFFPPGASQPLPTRLERAEQASQRAERAEAELRRLRAELGRPGDGEE